jgi:hypothetical protein
VNDGRKAEAVCSAWYLLTYEDAVLDEAPRGLLNIALVVAGDACEICTSKLYPLAMEAPGVSGDIEKQADLTERDVGARAG